MSEQYRDLFRTSGYLDRQLQYLNRPENRAIVKAYESALVRLVDQLEVASQETASPEQQMDTIDDFCFLFTGRNDLDYSKPDKIPQKYFNHAEVALLVLRARVDIPLWVKIVESTKPYVVDETPEDFFSSEEGLAVVVRRVYPTRELS